ncbi:hypothetical protein PEL8287_02355 [Roseovarius litorisediminis]|uniref:Lipoprotein n=1 Tax=Roseovarius litorisediminis TaxID=1312363 RepID=A0A1Y5SSU8_9RHOB|nr:hypothetical protein [Roseovarius litorisediminis]SLN45708.1 hypothetical protein PEL8287_02355 [Roseovarius litorisediminis]
MTILRKIACLLSVLALLAGCSTPPEQAPDEVSRLAASIRALSPEIDPAEATRAADIAVNYPKQLRSQYGVTDPPLLHNIKVNSGARPRGLCWHWAQDMETRLAQENFKTLDLHRAIANGHTRLLIDHSTVIVSSKGDDMFQGMVLDPWRYGGTLYWAPTNKDEKYTWVPREKVFAMKRARRQGQRFVDASDPSTEPLPEDLALAN